MVPLSLVCPYCGDKAIEPLPEAQLVAMNAPRPHIVSRAQICRCSAWHIFAVFLGQFNLSKSTPTQLAESNHV
jgi:hypothetical protein